MQISRRKVLRTDSDRHLLVNIVSKAEVQKRSVVHSQNTFGREISCGKKFSASVVKAATENKNSKGL